jgi:hypothetical protein
MELLAYKAFAFLTATALFSPLAAPSPAPVAIPTAVPVTVAVPGGTSISVSLGESVSSGTATVGDMVPIVVGKEVDINGMIVIAKGANGQATVSTCERAGGNGHGGKLGLSMDWVYSVDGGKIQLSEVNHSSENGDQKGAASTATIATYLLLGPLGLFAHNFVHGKDVTVPTDRVFGVFVDHDIHVAATQKASVATGFDN